MLRCLRGMIILCSITVGCDICGVRDECVQLSGPLISRSEWDSVVNKCFRNSAGVEYYLSRGKLPYTLVRSAALARDVFGVLGRAMYHDSCVFTSFRVYVVYSSYESYRSVYSQCVVVSIGSQHSRICLEDGWQYQWEVVSTSDSLRVWGDYYDDLIDDSLIQYVDGCPDLLIVVKIFPTVNVTCLCG